MSVCVLDTTVASLLLQTRPELSLYTALLGGTTMVISFQTVAEMRYGALQNNWGKRRKRDLELFLSSMTTVEYSSELADHWATIMQQARKVGRRLEAGDAWIAATSLYLNAPLLTHDKDFDTAACPSITVYCFAGN